MADRCNFYFRQMVTEAELDLAFELLEQADHNLASDLGIYGIVRGAEPVQHTPVPNLTIDLIAPGRTYDNLGQRISFGTDQNVDCAVDYTGIPTDVSQAGNERWLGIFLKFDRLLSDPRTDGNSQQVYFRHDEHFQILVRQAAEGPVGSAQKVPLVPDEILVCDVRRTGGQTQIIDADIDQSRRQIFIFAQGSSVAIDSHDWQVIAPTTETVQGAFDATDEAFIDHANGANPHQAEHVQFTPVNYLNSENVQSAMNELMVRLAATAAPSSGASRLGSSGIIGDPSSLSSGTIANQLAALLSHHNTHLNDSNENIHPAVGITVEDSDDHFDEDNVETVLRELALLFETQHYSNGQGQYYPGQHRTIRQPNLGTGRVMLFYSLGNGAQSARFRIFADSDDIWFTMNADWDTVNDQWEKDASGRSGGFRFGRSEIEFITDNAGSNTFETWENRWRLPMSEQTNSAFETNGTIREVGKVALQATNSYSSARVVSMATPVTFRNRFPAPPSSITLSANDTSGSWSSTPVVTDVNRDGFVVYSYQYTASQAASWWYGDYTAIV